MRDTTKEYAARGAQPLVIFAAHKFEVDPLFRAPVDAPVLLDPASTMSSAYGVAFQLQFREGTLPWSPRPSTFLIDRDGVLRYADDYEDRSPLWTPLQLLDDLKLQRSLIESLKTADGRYRKAADLALAPLGPATKSAVPVLAEALADRRSSLRAGAAAALYWIAPVASEAVPALARSLDDEDARVRRLAGLALGRMGKAAEPSLLKALKHKDPTVRLAAAWDLSRDPTPNAVPALIAALSDANASVRKAVVRSLVRLPIEMRTSQLVLDALAKALTDKTETVRHDASYGLGGMGARARGAIPLVVKAMRHPEKEASRWGRITWDSLRPFAREAIPDLIQEAIQDSGTRRDPALEALATIGTDATSALLALLKDGKGSERGGAAAALGHIRPNDKRVVPALRRSLADESSEVRTRAAAALGNYGPKARETVGALLKLLKDRDEATRLEAAKSLKKIDAEAARKAGVR